MDEASKRERIGAKATAEAQDWVLRMASGDMTEAELARFKSWRASSSENDAAFRRERDFWQRLDAADTRFPRDRRIADSHQPARRTFLIGGSAAMAASVAVLAAPRLKLIWDADYRTAAGEQRDVSLADGTRVTLNTDSALAVRLMGDRRLVELLQGEALFDVNPSGTSLFRVSALNGSVEASSGEFAIRAASQDVVVTSMSGDAIVRSPGASDTAAAPGSGAVRIASNQQTRYRVGSPPSRAAAVDIERELAWRTGRVIFEGRPFAEALAELGRYVPERIVLADRSRAPDPISAVFSVREATTAIAALAETQGLTMRRIPGVMIVLSQV